LDGNRGLLVLECCGGGREIIATPDFSGKNSEIASLLGYTTEKRCDGIRCTKNAAAIEPTSWPWMPHDVALREWFVVKYYNCHIVVQWIGGCCLHRY